MADVLLVDDDSSVLLTVAVVLQRQGHKVTTACNAEQALLQLKSRSFTFMITDIWMPGMNGIELAWEARRLSPTLRVILTSAVENFPLREGVSEAFLPKPIDPETLSKILTTERRRSTSEPTDSAPQRTARLSDRLQSAAAS